MKTLSRFELWYGSSNAPPTTQELRAGPITVQLEGVDLRYACAGDVELIRRVYVAVRDEDWGTLPAEYSNVEVDSGEDHFEVQFDCRQRQGDIDFHWHGTIAGASDGTITYSMEGEPLSTFSYNRIGICVLHPPEIAGHRFRAMTPRGVLQGTIPRLIGPQGIENGHKLPLVPSMTDLSIDMDGSTLEFQFEGDLFEMEDQRNWTDGSFKTYSTPLNAPLPKHAEPGQSIRQRISMSLTGRPKAASARPSHPHLTLRQTAQRGLPQIGFGWSRSAAVLSDRQRQLLRGLRPDHLRVDLDLRLSRYREELDRAIQQCEQLGCGLELAITLGDSPAQELNALALRLRHAPLRRLIVFQAVKSVTPGLVVQLAREKLRDVTSGVQFSGGTNAYFTEINAIRPDIEDLDAVAYSFNPQVHAFDNRSIVESLPVHGLTVESARAFVNGRALAAGPITFKPRFNPSAAGPEPPPVSGQLPSAVDTRQMSLFGAVWTVGSVKYLAESGADSVTYYETIGWQGLMEAEEGSPLPELFPSRPGMVFPLYHVFADLAEWKTGSIVHSEPSTPLAVDGLVIRGSEEIHVLLANMTPVSQRAVVVPLEVSEGWIRRLNEHTAVMAMEEPERFRQERSPIEVIGTDVVVDLEPYETARLDLRPSG